MAIRIFTFTEDGDKAGSTPLFSGRVEYWDYDLEEVHFFSKVFLDAKSRDTWIKDKKKALRLIGPIPPLAGSNSCPSTSPACLAA